MDTRRRFKIPILPSKLEIIFTDNLQKYVPGEAQDSANWVAMCDFDKPGRPKIILKYDCDAFTIMHESAHATFAILDYAQIGISADNHEIFCYLQEYIVDKILKIQTKL